MNHFFYYWIRGYWTAAKGYIEAGQDRRGEELRWNHIARVFEVTDEVEQSALRWKRIREFIRTGQIVRPSEEGRTLEQETRAFLQEEMDLLKPPIGKETA
jgi:hypothetical protein